MSDAPETIWAMEYSENYNGRRFIDTCTKITGSYKQPYIRADLHAAVVAERDELRVALQAIADGECVNDWSHKAEVQKRDFAEAALAKVKS